MDTSIVMLYRNLGTTMYEVDEQDKKALFLLRRSAFLLFYLSYKHTYSLLYVGFDS
jgi:hypothetical protein